MNPELSQYYSIGKGDILVDSQVNRGNSSKRYYIYSSTVDYRDFGSSFKGKRNHNLTLSDNIEGRPANTTSYTFDSKGRVSTATKSGKGMLFTYIYSYFDE